MRTYTSLLTHVIFSTKKCFPFITNDLRADLCPYLGGIRKRTFQEEFLDFLKRHEIEYDERYLRD